MKCTRYQHYCKRPFSEESQRHNGKLSIKPLNHNEYPNHNASKNQEADDEPAFPWPSVATGADRDLLGKVASEPIKVMMRLNVEEKDEKENPRSTHQQKYDARR